MLFRSKVCDIFRLLRVQIRSRAGCDNNRFWLYNGFDYWVTRRTPQVEQELLTLSEQQNSPRVLWGSCYSGFVFHCGDVRSTLSFVSFCWPWSCLSFDLTIFVCPFGIFEFLVTVFTCKKQVLTVKEKF